MRFSSEYKIVSLFEPLDANAGLDSQSFDMSKAAHACVVLMFGAYTVADATLTLFSGATDGVKTTALPFRYRMSQGDFKAASADLYGAETLDADGSLVLARATWDHRVMVIEIPAETLTQGEPWVTVVLSAGATALLNAGLAILCGLRYGVDQTAV